MLLQHPVMLVAFGFGAGLSKYAPGTVGSLLALPLVWFVSFFSPVTYLVVTCLVFVVGIYVSTKTSVLLGVKDHPGIVIDEVAGILVTFAFIPLSVTTLLAGFFLFRLLDIVKPFPVGYIDRKISGGVGVMMDDVAAGLLAHISLSVALIYLRL